MHFYCFLFCFFTIIQFLCVTLGILGKLNDWTENKILEGLSNTVSLVVVPVLDYWIENECFIEIYFKKIELY